MAWYKTGTVTVNNGDTYITGLNTRFATNARVGDGFRAPDGRWYEVLNIASETVLGIYPPYRGDTVSGSADYMIAPLQGYNKESADRLRLVTDNIRDFSGEVAAAQASAAAALVSENAAKVSENNSKTSETNSKTSETNAKTSEDNAKASELSATDSATSANASKIAAKTSEDNAKVSEDNAKISETNSKTSETNAKASEDAALVSKNASKASEIAAKTSETNSHTSELSAASDAAIATTGATTATSAKNDAVTAKNAAEQARDDAIAAAGSVTGVVKDMGPINLSSGVYPTKPVTSAFWKVVVGGTATDAGVTIEYGVGDTLMFSKLTNEFYKIDNTESVSSVAGKTGVVVLNKTDVGLSNVDNTSDLNKPISTAVQTQLTARTVTTSNVDITAGRLVKVGDYGENGGAGILKTNTDDPDTITVSGTYTYYQGHVKLPESCYLKHIKHTSAGYAKQIAYGYNSDKVYTRKQYAGTWTVWTQPSTEVIDSLTSTDATKALSANQGKVLKDLIDSGGGVNISRFTYNVSAGQTVISGVDLSGTTLTYTPGIPLFVDLNGFPIWIGNDYTATDGTSITLVTGPESASEISITVFKAKAVDNTYTKAEIDGKIGASALPVGLTVPWSLSEATIPGGMLPYNGQLVSRAVWPTLWALYSSQAISDATWLADPLQRGKPSTGDGSTTFRLPDFNGKHSDGLTPAAAVLRGYGKNSAGTPGLFQLDQLQNITGELGALYSRVGTSASGAFAETKTSGGAANGTVTAGLTTEITLDTSRVARTGTETRSTNVTIIWCVVGATALQNTGTIDVSALATHVNAQDAVIASLQGKPYVSAQQTITSSGTLSFAHGLGVVPSNVSFSLVCSVADAGFAVGDEVMGVGFYSSLASAAFRGVSIWSSDAVNIGLRFGQFASVFAVPHKTTGAFTALVNTSWKIIVRIYP